MKLIFILLTAVALQVTARGYTQSITLSFKNTPLVKIFESIQQQSNYRFFYNEEQLQKSRPVTISIKEARLEEALNFVLKDQPLTYAIINKIIVIKEKRNDFVIQPPKEPAPLLIDIKGRVVNEKGEPVIATVTVKGKDKGTTTNENGELELKDVDENATLVITAVNIESREIKVNGKAELGVITVRTRITEEDEILINTGYQKLKPNEATGSFEKITNEELNRSVGTDVLSRMEGVSSSVLFDRRGLTADQSTMIARNIIIRGLSTLTATIKAPLVVLNNFPYEGDINNINPNDVESITILKDAAATSIWGAKAGNGVIVITTKQGQFNQPTAISVNSSISMLEKPDLFYYKSMSSADYISVETFLFGKGFYNSDLTNTTIRPALTPVIELLAKRKAGLVSATDSASFIDAMKNQDVRNDFEKYFYRRAIKQQYALNVIGGGQRNRYFFSAGFDKNINNLIGDEFKRITLSASNTVAVNNKLEFETSVNYSNSSTINNSLGHINNAAYGYRSSRSIYPYAQLADASGNSLILVKDYRSGYTDTAGSGKLLDWKYRPIDEIKSADNTSRLQDILIGFRVRFKITNWINAEGSYQFEQANEETRNHYNQQTYFTRNLINLYTNFNSADPTKIRPIPLGSILDENFSKLLSHSGRLQVNVNRSFGRSKINSIIGGEVRERKSISSLNRKYGYNNDNLSFSAIDNINLYPRYGGRGNAIIPQNAALDLSTDHFVSLFGNVAYNLANKYTFSASARKDATNLFGVNINNKWSPFWTIGGAWKLSNEPFFRIKAISNLNLRLTYGYQGNVNNSLSPYAIISTAAAANNPLINQPYGRLTTPANPDLSWERIGQLNVGIDIGIFKNRIITSIDLYHKKSTNIILGSIVDPTTGIQNVSRNSANLTGKGLDITFSSKNIVSDVNWTTDIIFSYTTTRVNDYLLQDKNRNVSGFVSSNISIIAVKGISPYGLYSYPFAGLDPSTGDPRGYLGKQVSKDYLQISRQSIDTANIIYNGSSIPKYFGFLNNTVIYKGFSLAVSVAYRFGYYFRKKTLSYSALFNNGLTNADYAKRWQKPGDEKYTTVPSMIYPVSNANRDNFYAGSTVNVLKANNIRLQYIRLSYDFKKSRFSKMPFQNIQLFIYANNLGLIWVANDEKIDPDYDRVGFGFPPGKNFASGIKIDF